MFSHITLVAIALQVSVAWGCELHASGLLPSSSPLVADGAIGGCGLIGGASAGYLNAGLLQSSGGIVGGLYPASAGIVGGLYPASAGIVGDALPSSSGVIGLQGSLYPSSGLISSAEGLLNAGYLPGPAGGLIGGVASSGLYDSCLPQPTCINHRVEPVVRPVVDECLTQVPVVRKSIRHQEECFTRHVPVTDRLVSQQEEKYVRHVPVTQKTCRNVIELRTRHVPIVKSRTRTVVEPYTTHVPITEKYSRPVEESVTKHVPIVERRCRPIVHHNTRLIPITEKRIRPIVDTCVSSVPVKRRYVKNLVEQRVRAVAGPCCSCPPGAELNAGGLYPAGLYSSGLYPSGLNVLPSGLSSEIAATAGLSADASWLPSGAIPTDLGVGAIRADLGVGAIPADLGVGAYPSILPGTGLGPDCGCLPSPPPCGC